MQNELLLILIGAILGFLLDLLRINIEKQHQIKEQEKNSIKDREKNVREFLFVPSDKKRPPAWLRLIKTKFVNKYLQKDRTVAKSTNGVEDLEKDLSTIKLYLLTNTQVIGRQEDCEITLSDSAVSRIHALVRYEEGNFVIYDLGSKSGISVNKKMVRSGAVLYNEDIIEIGDSYFIFEGSKTNPVKRKKLDKTKTNLRKSNIT